MNDPIADMLTIIRNGYAARKEVVAVTFSSLKKHLAEKLKLLNYLEKVEEDKQDSKRVLKLTLRYQNGQPELQGVRRISKPGLRVYKANNEIQRVYGGLGCAIVSTNQGLLTDREARKKKVGGEVLCEVW